MNGQINEPGFTFPLQPVRRQREPFRPQLGGGVSVLAKAVTSSSTTDSWGLDHCSCVMVTGSTRSLVCRCGLIWPQMRQMLPLWNTLNTNTELCWQGKCNGCVLFFYFQHGNNSAFINQGSSSSSNSLGNFIPLVKTSSWCSQLLGRWRLKPIPEAYLTYCTVPNVRITLMVRNKNRTTDSELLQPNWKPQIN